MQKNLKPLVTTALLAALFLGALSVWLLPQLDWQTVASKQDPEGRWVGAHQLRLECTAEKIMKMVDAYKEVRIQHANVSTDPEAKTPLPSH